MGGGWTMRTDRRERLSIQPDGRREQRDGQRRRAEMSGPIGSDNGCGSGIRSRRRVQWRPIVVSRQPSAVSQPSGRVAGAVAASGRMGKRKKRREKVSRSHHHHQPPYSKGAAVSSRAHCTSAAQLITQRSGGDHLISVTLMSRSRSRSRSGGETNSSARARCHRELTRASRSTARKEKCIGIRVKIATAGTKKWADDRGCRV